MADQDTDQKTDIPSEAEKLDEELEKESRIKNQESSSKAQEEGKSESSEAEQAKVDAESQLSEEGHSTLRDEPSGSDSKSEVSSESTSPDVHEPDRTGPELVEGAELETQVQASERSDQEDQAEPPEPASKDNPNAKWYVVHTYAGHENKVATGLKQRIESEHLEDKILDLLVPTQDKIEIRAGKKETVKEKIFPGYILIKMVLDDGSWLAVRTTPGVTSFVGMGNKPTPISDTEVKSIVQYMKQGAPATFKDVFLPDDTVKIIDGPFADFIGKVDTVDKEKGKVRVLVSIFGRETPVELDFLQVQKL